MAAAVTTPACSFRTITMCQGPAQDLCCPFRTSLCCLAPPLTLKPLVPVRCHKGVDAAIRVDRIEWLEIVGADKDASSNTEYLTIHVFLKKDQSRLPTTGLVHKPTLKPTLKRSLHAMAKPARAEPDLCVRRSFEEFKTLFDSVMLAVQQRHDRLCYFCNDFQTLLVFSSTRSVMTFQALLSTDMKARVAQRLLHDLVALFQARQPTTGRRSGCEAVYEIPVILDAFLTETEP